jgi:hypothetical protein
VGGPFGKWPVGDRHGHKNIISVVCARKSIFSELEQVSYKVSAFKNLHIASWPRLFSSYEEFS